MGLDVQPASDRLNVEFSDTLELQAWSEFEDSIPTSRLSAFLLGSVYDPIFGKTSAGIYTQLLLSANSVSFGTNPVVDSFILVMPYKGYYGDTNVIQNVSVYELNQGITRDSTYFSNRKIDYIPTPLTSNPTGFSFAPRPTTWLTINSANVAPQLRIPLSNSYATSKILVKSGQTELSDNSNFISYLKGLYIKTSPVFSQGGNYSHFEFSEGYSKAILYYHNDSDTTSFEFSIRNDSACFVGYNHGYKVADNDFKKELINKDTNMGKQILYVAPGGGVRTVIKFPNLKNFISTGNILINEAELVIPAYQSDAGIYTVPEKLSLARLGSDGLVYFLIDNTNPGGDDITFGGYYDSTKKEYRFRIKGYIQQLLNGLIEDKGLYLRVSGSSVKGNRLLINGTLKTNPDNRNRIRLRLTYTRI